MAYASSSDMIDMFGNTEVVQLTDRINAGLIDSAVLTMALDDATSEADSYLPVPPTTASRALVRHTASIARFLLWKDKASQEVRDRYDDAVAWLKLAAKGVVDYGTLPTSTTQQPGRPQVKSLILNHEQYAVPSRGYMP